MHTESVGWLHELFETFCTRGPEALLLEELKERYEQRASLFASVLRAIAWKTLKEKGVLLLS